MNDEKNNKQTAEELASVMQKAAIQLQSIGRTDLILHALVCLCSKNCASRLPEAD